MVMAMLIAMVLLPLGVIGSDAGNACNVNGVEKNCNALDDGVVMLQAKVTTIANQDLLAQNQELQVQLASARRDVYAREVELAEAKRELALCKDEEEDEREEDTQVQLIDTGGQPKLAGIMTTAMTSTTSTTTVLCNDACSTLNGGWDVACGQFFCKACHQCTTSRAPTPTPTTDVPSGRLIYKGCYRNEGDDRATGHKFHMTVDECQQAAAAAGVVHFGMEYPEGSPVVGEAECLVLTAPPSMVEAPDSECEGEGLFNYHRLGGPNRLALYVLTDGVPGLCRSSSAPWKRQKWIRDVMSVGACEQACLSRSVNRCAAFAWSPDKKQCYMYEDAATGRAGVQGAVWDRGSRANHLRKGLTGSHPETCYIQKVSLPACESYTSSTCPASLCAMRCTGALVCSALRL